MRRMKIFRKYGYLKWMQMENGNQHIAFQADLLDITFVEK